MKEGRHLKGWQITVPKAPTEQEIVSVSTNHIENCTGTSLEIQRLTLSASTAGGVGLQGGVFAFGLMLMPEEAVLEPHPVFPDSVLCCAVLSGFSRV